MLQVYCAWIRLSKDRRISIFIQLFSKDERRTTMQIAVHSWEEVEVSELAALTCKVRQAKLGSEAMTPGGVERLLQNHNPLMLVVAHSDLELIGWLGLWPIGESTLAEINPGRTLGSHPIVSPGYDQKEVGTELIRHATNWAEKEGYTAVYLDFPWNLAEPLDSYAFYEEWYESLGFRRVQKVRYLTYDLAGEPLLRAEAPPGFSLVQIQKVDEEDLYRCHHAAFEAGDAEYFHRMNDKERRADFQRINSVQARSDAASLALLQGQRVVGLTLVFSEGQYSTLDSIGIHPQFRRVGLGECLLRHCLKQAADHGSTSMSLICDIQNQRALELYKKVGFEDRGGSITYEWKVSAGSRGN
jgi:ribosomal protein S18 acetylase RimI-like enzyme